MAPFSGTIELHGHIVDSLTLSKVLDEILEAGADYDTEALIVGKGRSDPSYARIRVTAPDRERLAELLDRIAELGAERVA
jgi:hypothetical protein